MAENSVKIKIDGDDSGLQSKLGGIGKKAKLSLADVKAGFDMASQAAQKLADASVKVYAGFDDAMRQVQATMNASAQHRVFQSQLLPVWGTTCPSDKKSKKNLISIVAPRAGSDGHEGIGGQKTIFQSTLPMRGATSRRKKCWRLNPFFNPRSPCGERQARWPVARLRHIFNPRSPCGERP